MKLLLALSTFGLIQARNKTLLTRSLASIGDQLAQYNGYGCWCYFDETNYARGKGVPVDDVDRLCKNYSEGFQCIMMADEACMPYSESYVSPANLDGSTDIITECNTANVGNQCAIDTCIVEAQFLVDFELVGAVSLTIKYLHALNFDVEANCIKIANANSGQRDSCCGDYPERYPYRSMAGFMECCSDGKVRPGSC